MNDMTADAAGRPSGRPWERSGAAPATPWKASAPDDGPEVTIRPGLEDEAAATRLMIDAMSPRGGLGSAILGGLLMLAAVTTVLATTGSRWKAPYPTGLSLVAVLALIAVFAGLGWLVGSRLLPWVRRRAALAHARRVLDPGRGGLPPDGGGPVRVVLGERALHWKGAAVRRRFDVSLLTGLLEDRDHMLLRFGLVSVVILPRRDLTAAQQAAVQDWAARHARAGRLP